MSAPAHPEVIALLETYLQLARENSFAHVAISIVGHPGYAAADYAGELSLDESQKESMQILMGRLDKGIENWTLPPQDSNLDHSYVRYNLANGPLGHDFLYWLLDAEMTRVREGAPAPLKVAFYKGLNPEETMNKDKREMWLNNLLRPSLQLIGAVEDERALYGHHKNLFVPQDIIAASKAGEFVPRFKAPASSKPFADALPKDYVTITLREGATGVNRNPNLFEWLKFADWLEGRGERVIFVRDTAKAYEPLGRFLTCPPASVDLHCRMALYENAKCNMFTSNGPCVLAIHSDRPWLVFIKLQDDVEGFIDTPKFWEKTVGLAPGQQYTWSAANQRVVWSDYTCENFTRAWEEHINPAVSLAA